MGLLAREADGTLQKPMAVDADELLDIAVAATTNVLGPRVGMHHLNFGSAVVAIVTAFGGSFIASPIQDFVYGMANGWFLSVAIFFSFRGLGVFIRRQRGEGLSVSSAVLLNVLFGLTLLIVLASARAPSPADPVASVRYALLHGPWLRADVWMFALHATWTYLSYTVFAPRRDNAVLIDRMFASAVVAFGVVIFMLGSTFLFGRWWFGAEPFPEILTIDSDPRVLLAIGLYQAGRGALNRRMLSRAVRRTW